MGLGQTLIDGAELGYTSLGVSCYDWKNNDREKSWKHFTGRFKEDYSRQQRLKCSSCIPEHRP